MRAKERHVKMLLCVLFLALPARAKYGGGTGEPNDPYLIYTAEQMNTIGANYHDWDRHFKLMADIDLSGYTGTDFNIIGDGFLPAFTGAFDGSGHTISNFTYSSTDVPCVGIFGYIDGPDARISNLGLIDPNVEGGTGVGVGPLAGWIVMGTITNCYAVGGNVIGKIQVGGLIGTSAGAITDCYAVGNRVMAERNVGGLVGSNSGSIIGCYATGNVTGSHRVGGLAGANSGFSRDDKQYKTGVVEECYAAGTVSGGYRAGGLVGYNNEGTVTNCFSTTDVTGKNHIGGLVGDNGGQVIDCYCSCTLDAQDRVGGLVGINDGIITASRSSADVQGRDEVGGLVGYNTGYAEIVDCYTNGDVLGQRYVGGLVGNNVTVIPRAGEIRSGTIRNCYSVTRVSGDQSVGGLVGHYGDDGVSGSFWDTETSGLTSSDDGIGLTTSEIQTTSTFLDAGWDFVDETTNGIEDTWWIYEGKDYPRLWWELPVKYGGGTGEPNDPYLIYTAEQMNTIGANYDDWDKHFKLMADMDLSGYAGTDFSIVGADHTNAFTGIFDGNGHTISNFICTYPDRDYVGLFGYIKGSEAEIRNLGLVDPNVDAGAGHSIGSLVGYVHQGTIANCYVEGGTVSGRGMVGGLVGTNLGTIDDCYSTADSFGNDNVGGLAGSNGFGTIIYGSGMIINCSALGGIAEGRRFIGGLVGTNSGTIVHCSAKGSVSGIDRDVGGLVGSNRGVIANCSAEGDVLGRNSVGGLVGENDRSITTSFSSASVEGRDEVGGLVGHNSHDAETVNCYADGNVVGQRRVGGLVGENTTPGGRAGGQRSGVIRNSYSVATVSGDELVGGLAGHSEVSEVRFSFWDIEASGQTASDGGTGMTTAQMQDPNTFINAGWGFVGATRASCDVWAEPDGGGYPVFWWQLSPQPDLPIFSGGTGEPDNPYLISTTDELNSIGNTPELMAASFRLIADIDLAGVDFCIIASQLYPFSGTFDGDGYTISNFSYTSAEATGIGLFGYVAGGEIKNLGLITPHLDVERGNYHGSLVGRLDAGTVTDCYVEAGSVSGDREVGGLVGQNGLRSAITDCYCTGSVDGDDKVGGLLGKNRGIVTNCWSTCSIGAADEAGGLAGENDGSIATSWSYANVDGRNAVGGLVGRNGSGEVLNCYARGSVAGQWYVGGLVGSNAAHGWRFAGTIHNCYSAATVSKGGQTGGLVGSNVNGEVTSSFWDVETSGLTSSYGGTPKTTAEMQTAGTFLDAGWDFVNETENGVEDIWRTCQEPDYPTLTGKGLPQ